MGFSHPQQQLLLACFPCQLCKKKRRRKKREKLDFSTAAGGKKKDAEAPNTSNKR
jgi:hypothetical protein